MSERAFPARPRAGSTRRADRATDQRSLEAARSSVETALEPAGADAATYDVADTHFADSDFGQNDLAQNDLAQNDLAQNDFAQNDLAQNDFAQNDFAQNDFAQNDLAQNDLAQNDLAQNDLAQNDLADDDVAYDARPSRRWRRWLAVVLVLAVLAGLTWIVAFSPVLAARAVKVEGAARLTRAQIVAAAGVPMDAPLVRIDRGAIARRVEQLPEIRAARVELSFPDTVVIAVTERVAAAYGQTATGHFTYVDATGRTFGDLVVAPSGLPRLAPSNQVAKDPVTLAAMAQISAALPASIRSQVDQLTATAPDDITLALRDGRSVVWGDATRNADKARILPALLKRKGRVYDVSNPDQVFTH